MAALAVALMVGADPAWAGDLLGSSMADPAASAAGATPPVVGDAVDAATASADDVGALVEDIASPAEAPLSDVVGVVPEALGVPDAVATVEDVLGTATAVSPIPPDVTAAREALDAPVAPSEARPAPTARPAAAVEEAAPLRARAPSGDTPPAAAPERATPARGRPDVLVASPDATAPRAGRTVPPAIADEGPARSAPPAAELWSPAQLLLDLRSSASLLTPSGGAGGAAPFAALLGLLLLLAPRPGSVIRPESALGRPPPILSSPERPG